MIRHQFRRNTGRCMAQFNSPEVSSEIAYQAAKSVSELQTEGITYFVKGENSAAATLWSKSMEVAQIAAVRLGFNLDTRYLCSESWTNGFGHIALLDFFAKRKLLGLDARRYVVLTRPELIANQFYLDLWRPYFEIVAAPTVPIYPDCIRFLVDCPMVLELDGVWLPFMEAVAQVEQRWCEQKRSPLLSLPLEVVERGWVYLATLGIPRDRWFVTINVREHGMVSGRVDDFSSVRNANLADYIPAVAAIVKAGGHPIRIGREKTRINVPSLIDLGTAPDWLDIFLLSQCKFFLGMNSGPAWVAGTFGVPALLVNWAPKAVPYGFGNARMLYKRLCKTVDGSIVNPLEGDPLNYIESGKLLNRMGVKAVSNSPQEIEKAVVGMVNTD